ncbi:MAG: aminoacyl-tRNA hydrolase [Clostridia bacterium]|nr:aminoacyl-tRNA hydrolase [Clostridia bacterium]
MYIIVGLGNPGGEYEKTRHNTGYMFLDRLASKYNISVTKEKFKAKVGDGHIEGKKVLLVKPETYMNNSGESVIEIVNFYKEDLDNVLIVYDDIDLPVGKIRIRESGSAGTHNGMKSVLAHLGSKKVKRIRIGIGKPNIDLINYVLGNFTKEEIKELDVAIDNAVDAASIIVSSGINKAMEKYN